MLTYQILKQAPVQQSEKKVFNASDFANGNFIACGNTHYQPQPSPVVQVNKEVKKTIAVYPNPAKNKTVNVYFNNIRQAKA